MNESGGRNAKPPENHSALWNGGYGTGTTEVVAGSRILVGSSDMSLDDAISMHLVDCEQCRDAISNLKPRGIGQRTGLCDEYLQLQLLRAQHEGRINNIVAYTEHGDETQKGRPLE